MTPTVVWTISSSLGILLSIVRAVRGYRDLQALRAEHENGSAELTAKAGIRDQALRACVFLAFATVGLLVLVKWPVPSGLFIWLLVGGNVLLMLNGVLNDRDDRRVINEIKAERLRVSRLKG